MLMRPRRRRRKHAPPPLLFLAAGLATLATIGATASCASGGACMSTADDVAGLSMLQRAAGRAALGPGGAAVAAGAPRTVALLGASLLCLRFALPPGLEDLAAKGGLLGEPRRGGFVLDEGGHVLVTIAYFPEAPMGWSGTAGSSDRVNLPHHLFSVQLPILQKSRAFAHMAYALADDDTTVNLYRMGDNIPAKLANFSVAALGPASSSSIRIDRRDMRLIDIEGIAPISGATAGENDIADFFRRPDVNLGTGANNHMFTAFPMAYAKRTLRATAVRSVTPVSIRSFRVSDSDKEGLDSLLGDGARLISALTAEADLQATTQMESVQRSEGMPPEKWAMTTWKNMGGETTELQKGDSTMAYQNGDIVWATFKVNEAQLAPYLPPSATLRKGDAIVWLTRWQPADVLNNWGFVGKVGPVLLEYNELWVEVPVTIDGLNYMLPLVMLLDDDVAMLAGRDMGCPKKLGNLTYTFTPAVADDAEVRVDVSRRGRDIFRLSGRLGERSAAYEAVPGVTDHRPAAAPQAFVSVVQFSFDAERFRPSWLFVRGMDAVAEQRPLHGVEVEFGDGAPEPLGRWFTGPATGAGYVRMDMDWVIPLAGGAQFHPVALQGYQEWWERSFSVLYM